MSKTENINQKIDLLNQSVEWFSSDDFKLEKAAENYQKAVDLAKEIEQDLTKLKNKIEVINEDFTKA